MKSRFIYMKLLGLLLVIVGFSYSLTSFNNFFSFIFNTRIFPEGTNIFIASIGLIFPFTVFIYGVYFYFYTDFNITKINKMILIFNLMFIVVAGVMTVFNSLNNFGNVLILQIFEFIHESFSYLLFLLGAMGLYGCFKYKY